MDDLFDTSELHVLIGNLGKIESSAHKTIAEVVDASGEDLRAAWVANATETSGTHGKWYPQSITASPKVTLSSIAVEVGPEFGKRQGRMGKGFEYGSDNQPPHLDGNRAASVEAPKYAARLQTTLGLLMGML